MLPMAITRTDKILIIVLLLQCVVVSAGQYGDCIISCVTDLIYCHNDCYDDREDCLEENSSAVCNPIYTACTDSCDANYNICSGACDGIDEDGDGVGDYNDSVIGTEDDVQVQGLTDLTIHIGSYQSNETDASNVDTTETVTIDSAEGPVLEFEQDFSDSSLDLFDIEIKKEKHQDRHGIIIKGINQSTVPEKAIYLEKKRMDSALCIKDAEIDSINDVSSDCRGTNELYFGRCEDVETIGRYTCSIEGGFYKIEGLTHSGAVEMNITGVFSGFFTLQYHTEAQDHKDGYMIPGETISICYESARPIQPDEHLRLVFVPKVGGLSINEMYTPAVINGNNVHIYP